MASYNLMYTMTYPCKTIIIKTEATLPNLYSGMQQQLHRGQVQGFVQCQLSLK